MIKLRNILLIPFVILIAFSCNTQETNLVLLSEDLAKKHTEWKVIPENKFNHNFVFDNETGKVPLNVNWTIAQDTISNCYKIASFKLERIGGASKAAFSDISSEFIECAMKMDSEDTTRFESILIKGTYKTLKGLKTYSYSGPLVIIS